ncbi:MAG TPA: sugar efflux transporter [Lacunisphaera sp.]|nr:sugar efflux transporter [Lacunisphaera sp.]
MQRVLGPLRTIFRQREFVAVLAANIVHGLGSSFVSPFMSMFGTIEVGMNPAAFGVFMTVTAVSSILIATWLSHRSDTHHSRRFMLLLGSAGGVLGYAGYAFVRDVWALILIGSLALGVASITFAQLFAHAREALGRSQVPAAEVPLYMNLFRMFFALSWTVGPALAAAVIHVFSYRGLFVTAAALQLLLLVLVAAFVPAAPRNAQSPAQPPVAIDQLLRLPGLFPWFVAFVLVFIAGTMSMMNMSLLVLRVLGGTETQVGIIFSLAPCFELPCMFYAGMLATRVDQPRLIRTAVLVSVVYYAALTLVRVPWQIYPLQFLSAAFVSVTAGVAITFFQDKIPRQPGAATNVYVNAMRVGNTAGYLLFGAIAAGFGFRAVYVTCALLSLGALGLMMRASGARDRISSPNV